MKHKVILFVCTGNTCRSPMAEAVLKARLKEKKIKWYTVRSAGLAVEEGSVLNPQSALALREKGIVAPVYTSRQLTEKMISSAHAVVCMTERQAERLKDYPNVTSCLRLFGRDIPDPYGQGMEAYRAALSAIEAGMALLMEKLQIKPTPKG